MAWQRDGLAGLLLMGGLAPWLLIARPSQLLGIDTGNAGMVLRTTTAWIGLAFMAAAIVYFLVHADALHGTYLDNPDANRVGRNLVLLLIAWSVLARVLKSRWKGEIEEDERDRLHAVQGRDWGYGALVAYVIGLALLLGFSQADKLQWASYSMIGNLLVPGLMWACAFEYGARVLHYRRDRS